MTFFVCLFVCFLRFLSTLHESERERERRGLRSGRMEKMVQCGAYCFMFHQILLG
jgi:hypothetical protein